MSPRDSNRDLPYPPPRLAERVGAIGHTEFYAVYDNIGKALRDDIVRLLPTDWSWEDKRVLDFGCGAGRVLRQFVEEARGGHFCGSDIHAESVGWLRQNASPPFEVVRNGDVPPLPWDDASFELIWAVSVFSHVTDEWSAWLIELHRLLRDDGRLIVSFMGAGCSQQYADEPWHEGRIGMNVLRKHQSWDLGGPFVLHSPWWIREHWGRAFEIDELWPSGFGIPHSRELGQGVVLMRKRPVRLTRDVLESIHPAAEREVAALRHNITQIQHEQGSTEASTRAGYEQTRSWRITRPLRWAHARLHAIRIDD